MTEKARVLTRHLKVIDRNLYADHDYKGTLCVWQRIWEFVPVIDEDGFSLKVLKEGRHMVTALTDNWSQKGKPRDWGIEPVLQKIRENVRLTFDRYAQMELEANDERIDESKRRSLRNEIEGFWSYERRRFAKATDDVLTHSLPKTDSRRKKEKSWRL